MLTTPGLVFKSSTKDLSFPIFEIVFQHTLYQPYLREGRVRCNFMMLDTQKCTYSYS
jgi:hypothetical protein